MVIDDKLLADLAVSNLSYKTVCDFFGLTPSERLNPNAGEWIVDCIKQFQTSSMIAKSMKLREVANTSVEGYKDTTLMPTNPLLNEELPQ